MYVRVYPIRNTQSKAIRVQFSTRLKKKFMCMVCTQYRMHVHVRACDDRVNASLAGTDRVVSPHHSLRIVPLSVSLEM